GSMPACRNVRRTSGATLIGRGRIMRAALSASCTTPLAKPQRLFPPAQAPRPHGSGLLRDSVLVAIDVLLGAVVPMRLRAAAALPLDQSCLLPAIARNLGPLAASG